MGKPKSTYRTFIIEWKYEDLERGIEQIKLEEYRVKRLKNSDAEVQVALSHVLLQYKNNTQPRWQEGIANHAFIWDKPMNFMYCHASLEDFTESGVRADRLEV